MRRAVSLTSMSAARLPQACRHLSAAGGLLQVVVPALLLLAGAGDVDRAEHLPERGDCAAPAHSDQVAQQPRLLGLVVAAPVAAARPGPVEHQAADALGVPRRVLDRGRPAAGQAQQREALEFRSVHHGSQVADVGVERRRAVELAVREPAAAFVEADERVSPAQLTDPVSPDRALRARSRGGSSSCSP